MVLFCIIIVGRLGGGSFKEVLMLDRYLLLGIFLPADGGIFLLFFFIIFMFNIVLIIITGISQFLHFINAVYWCSFCKDPERLRCNDDP